MILNIIFGTSYLIKWAKSCYNFNMKLASVVELYPSLYNFQLQDYSKRNVEYLLA